tara:strand:- start:2432 stop:2629 length:198 start_codon:yes stop_codon:yes gene_type:complete
MTPRMREAFRFVTIGLAFGAIWAIMQYANGQIRDVSAMLGPFIVCGFAGLLMWGFRRLVVYLRNR